MVFPDKESIENHFIQQIGEFVQRTPFSFEVKRKQDNFALEK